MAGQANAARVKLNETPSKSKGRKLDQKVAASKRRCIGSACTACKRRKSKCDGALPSCAACTAVYGTVCEYDLASDHRRKGVYKKDNDTKPKIDTLQILIEALLNYPEEEAFDLVRRIRSCENLEIVASEVQTELNSAAKAEDEPLASVDSGSLSTKIEHELSAQVGHMRLADGTIHFLGGTSNLQWGVEDNGSIVNGAEEEESIYTRNEDIIRSWTTVTSDVDLILHLLQMYFTWHYPSFVTLSKSLFFKDFFRGKPNEPVARIEYCTPLLVNSMLSLGCHFTSRLGARSEPDDPGTAGDHFFREAKRLIIDNDEFENPRIPTIQALALMSVREAGCAREAKGWVYSGMSFRMACDLGLDVDLNMDRRTSNLTDEDIDARRITFWGCYQFDKCWSNYLGRPPQLARSNITVDKFEVFPDEDSESWSPRNDSGIDKSSSQPARTRAVALQMSTLCEISEELMFAFYSPSQSHKLLSKTAEVKRLSDFHTRLEAWLKNLPKEMEARDGSLPYVLVMHMFFQLLYIHLFRPFLKYTKSTSPLPPEVSPRKLCTQAAMKISKLLRLYKKTYGLNQICNIVVYIAHSACSIHLLNLPDKDARRDLSHGVRHLEEIAEYWPCAPRTLNTLAVQVRRWKIELPEDITAILHKWENKYKADHALSVHSKDSPMVSSPSERSSPNVMAEHILQSYPHNEAASVRDRFFPSSSVEEQTRAATQLMDIDEVVSGRLQPHLMNQLPQHTRTWPKARPPFQSSKKRPMPSQLYGGIDSLFEENKDWWYKDQSAYYENWSRRDSTIPGTSHDINGPELVMTANSQNPDSMLNTSPDLNELTDWTFDNTTVFDYNSEGVIPTSRSQI